MAVLRAFRQAVRKGHLCSTVKVSTFVLTLALGFMPGVALQALQSKEFQVKAAFLFNFAQFVEWPSEAFSRPSPALVIGVLGDDPFGPYLDEIVKGERVNGRPLVVQRFSSPDEIQACHVLYVSRSESPHLSQVLLSLKDRAVLTVGDQTDFARKGGMVQFFTDNGRIRLRINVGASRSAHLAISSKLLKVAEIVSSEGG